MGEHMAELGDKEEAQKKAVDTAVSPEDQAQLNKIMQDPEGEPWQTGEAGAWH